MTPLISVVIPSYNRRAALVRAIASALDQLLPPFEIIVVDDGSSDGTKEIDFHRIDPRIRLIEHPTKRGAAAARNTGIDAARGEWVALLDSDDIWLDSKLERQFAALRERPIGDKPLVSCNVMRSFEHQGSVPYNPSPPGEGHLSEYFLLNGGTLQTSTLLLPTLLAKQVRFDERLGRHQDWDFVLRLVRAGAEVHYIHDTLVIYDANDYPDKISAQKSIRPTVDWLKLAGPLITPRVRHTFYLSRCFHQHLREQPFNALLTLAVMTLAYLPSFPQTARYFWGFLAARLGRAVTSITLR